MKKALTIAGLDPSGGAGVQADLRVFSALGVYGLSVAAALTAQNTSGVVSVLPVDHRFVKKQLSVLFSDILPDAVKIGMLYSGKNTAAVADIIKEHSLKNIVLDPVLVSSSGRHLAEKDMIRVLVRKLLPLCTVITPNIHEASVLSGITIGSSKDMERAAMTLRELGPETVIITGGHLEKTATDVIYDGRFHYLKSRKFRGEFHGTGCAFSSAVAAFLAQGKNTLDAAMLAKHFIKKALKTSSYLGKGMMILHI